MEKPFVVPNTEYETIFRAYITLKNGKRIYASQFGKKAFPIRVPLKGRSS